MMRRIYEANWSFPHFADVLKKLSGFKIVDESDSIMGPSLIPWNKQMKRLLDAARPAACTGSFSVEDCRIQGCFHENT
jgi:hypothetical protein